MLYLGVQVIGLDSVTLLKTGFGIRSRHRDQESKQAGLRLVRALGEIFETEML